MTGQQREGRCARCHQTRHLFPAAAEWGTVPSPLCTTDWQKYASARAAHTYVDWADACDNATDEELARAIGGVL